ncbi:hypothetical protein [Haladaptatus caseinilyticus]|uniref:hypothetical protein n=1 Tax=Haladaptatus caseinilyticus TaxID=2993314 RepID=UPI00224B5ACD|nr:hypothetical protein [Haladaptatus caseinilyticus]
MYSEVVEEIAREFVDNPADFVTEYDLQARHHECLRNKLRTQDCLSAEVEQTSFENTTSYKQDQWQAVQSAFLEQGLTRVHGEVSKEKNNRFDIVVLNERLTHPVRWIDGVKKFDERDFSAVIELKFVKNKDKFPTHARSTRLGSHHEDGEIQDELDFGPNKIKEDLERLTDLPDSVETYLALYSNKNYLYTEPVSERERNYHEYSRIGRLARQQIEEMANETNVLYAMPRGYTWISEQ